MDPESEGKGEKQEAAVLVVLVVVLTVRWYPRLDELLHLQIELWEQVSELGVVDL